jgi:hypothetical protein
VVKRWEYEVWIWVGKGIGKGMNSYYIHYIGSTIILEDSYELTMWVLLLKAPAESRAVLQPRGLTETRRHRLFGLVEKSMNGRDAGG